jgi:hypothetical protein
MPKTRPDGSPLTPDDLEYWNQPYVYEEFPKMLYRRRRLGVGRRSVADKRAPEGTITATDGTTVLEYLTVQSAAEEADAATEGWTELAVAIANAPKTAKSQSRP